MEKGEPSSTSTSEKNTKDGNNKKPTVVLVLGMAGSGKTTFVQRLTAHLSSTGGDSKTTTKLPYVINLDPAVSEVPYPCNIDIQDTINYKEVMKQYGLGPNGAIMTSLNLFSTKFDQVMNLVQKRSTEVDHIIVDTPGQIEVFTWSASGAIITETLASQFPTVVIYVMDTARSVNPITFMSNMLYACSILYKTKLPFIVVMNKTDIVDHQFAVEWTNDFEAFHDALENEQSYASNLTRSMSLVLDEFYNNLTLVGFSSMTGQGTPQLLTAIDKARDEYINDYKPEYDKLRERQLAELKKKKDHGKTTKLPQDAEITGVKPTGSSLIVTKGADNDEEYTDDEDDDNFETEGDVESLKRYIDMHKAKSNNKNKT